MLDHCMRRLLGGLLSRVLTLQMLCCIQVCCELQDCLQMLQDRGDSPYDPVYEKVLTGLNLVARHAAMPLLDALLAWRKDAESQAQRSGVELVVLRKKVHSACLYELIVAVCSSSACPAQHEWMEKLYHISDRLYVKC